MKAPIVEDENCMTYKYSESDTLKKQIDDKKYRYLKRKEYLESNIDYRTNKHISDDQKEKLLEKNNKNYYNYLLKLRNGLPNMKFDMDEEEYAKCTFIIKSELDYAERFIVHKKELRAVVTSSLLFLALAGTVVGLPTLVHKKELNSIYYEKTIAYQEELDKVVASSTHEKYGTNDYNNGQITHVPDNRSSSQYIKYVDYDIIADHIEESDNPDLELYLLYKNYGTKKGVPIYNGITSETCKRLIFLGDNEDYVESFYDYVKKNGYKNPKEYDKACKKELVLKKDDILDNLSLNVKKND